MNRAIFPLALAPVIAVPGVGFALDAETLQVGQPMARFALMKQSSRPYVRYQVKGEQRLTLDIWHREVALEQHDGQPSLHVIWR